MLQIRYLNMAMERFGNTETVPVYYVLFTLTTIVGSNILYRDFEKADRVTVALFALGCALTFSGVKLLTSRRSRAEPGSIPYPPPDFADEKRRPMLAHAHHPAGGRADHGLLGIHHCATDGLLDGYLDDFDERYRGDDRLRPLPPPLAPPYPLSPPTRTRAFQPLTLVNTPMGFSGDVLRRTFGNLERSPDRSPTEGTPLRGTV